MPSRSPSASFQPVRGLISWLTIFARLNRSVNRRFHVDDEDASILRTLQTLENSYEKILDQGDPPTYENFRTGEYPAHHRFRCAGI
jgi:hypothetical protein